MLNILNRYCDLLIFKYYIFLTIFKRNLNAKAVEIKLNIDQCFKKSNIC